MSFLAVTHGDLSLSCQLYDEAMVISIGSMNVKVAMEVTIPKGDPIAFEVGALKIPITLDKNRDPSQGVGGIDGDMIATCLEAVAKAYRTGRGTDDRT